jgi:predicted PurR-regulated permease PerM
MARDQFSLALRVIILCLAVIFGLLIISPFFIPILMGATISLALFPLQQKLKSMGWGPKYAAATVTLTFGILIATPFLFFLIKGTLMIVENPEVPQRVIKFLGEDLGQIFLNLVRPTPLADFFTPLRVEQYLKNANHYMLNFFQKVATDVPSLFIFSVVMLVCTFSFLKNAQAIRHFFQGPLGFSSSDMDELVGIFLRNSRQVFIANGVTGIIQSLLVATGVSMLARFDWGVIFFITLILSFIPVIGAAPMAFVFSLVLFFRDQVTEAIVLGALGVFAGLIDNFLRPWLTSLGKSSTPAIVSFVFVIGGALLLGFPGLFIGLLSATLIFDTLPIFWKKISSSSSSS